MKFSRLNSSHKWIKYLCNQYCNNATNWTLSPRNRQVSSVMSKYLFDLCMIRSWGRTGSRNNNASKILKLFTLSYFHFCCCYCCHHWLRFLCTHFLRYRDRRKDTTLKLSPFPWASLKPESGTRKAGMFSPFQWSRQSISYNWVVIHCMCLYNNFSVISFVGRTWETNKIWKTYSKVWLDTGLLQQIQGS